MSTRQIAGVLLLVAFAFWMMSYVIRLSESDNKVIQACVDKGGVVMNSMQGFVCVSKEFLIKIEVE